MALPKTRRTRSRKGSRQSQDWAKAQKPALKKVGAKTRVPRHVVTAANPEKGGVQFVATSDKKRK